MINSSINDHENQMASKANTDIAYMFTHLGFGFYPDMYDKGNERAALYIYLYNLTYILM